MGGATFLIGLLPTFETIGVLGPDLARHLRIVQGLGLGGEWGGAALMASEHSPPNRRGFYASSVQMGAAGGLIISAGVIAAVSALMTEAQFVAWGWRIPFLASIILIAVGAFIRFQIAESEAFIRLKEAGAEARMPIVEVFRTRPKNVLLAAGTSGAQQRSLLHRLRLHRLLRRLAAGPVPGHDADVTSSWSPWSTSSPSRSSARSPTASAGAR